MLTFLNLYTAHCKICINKSTAIGDKILTKSITHILTF